jgi:hypothetical protein
MDIMYYCPNCSAFLEDPNAPVCPKCGFDRLKAHQEEERGKKKGQIIEPRETADDFSSLKNDMPADAPLCPVCKMGLKRSYEHTISFDLMGKEVTIQHIRIMGMNLHKRAITQCIVNFEGWECGNRHRFFTKYTQSYKELCPVCREVMKKFGQQVRSCTHCKINISGDNYLKLKGRELLEDEGWIFKPELAEQSDIE